MASEMAMKIARGICAQHTAISLPLSRMPAEFEIVRVAKIIDAAVEAERERVVMWLENKNRIIDGDAEHVTIPADFAATIRKREKD